MRDPIAGTTERERNEMSNSDGAKSSDSPTVKVKKEDGPKLLGSGPRAAGFEGIAEITVSASCNDLACLTDSSFHWLWGLGGVAVMLIQAVRQA